MNAIDDYRTENNRDTTRSCHRLNNRTTPKFMAFAIIQISRDNHQRNLQVLDVLGPQVSPQEITKALTIEQTRLRNRNWANSENSRPVKSSWISAAE